MFENSSNTLRDVVFWFQSARKFSMPRPSFSEHTQPLSGVYYWFPFLKIEIVRGLSWNVSQDTERLLRATLWRLLRGSDTSQLCIYCGWNLKLECMGFFGILSWNTLALNLWSSTSVYRSVNKGKQTTETLLSFFHCSSKVILYKLKVHVQLKM